MANFSLLELGQNDELTTVIKKSNMNFRNLGWALKQKIQQASDGSSEWKQAIANLREETEQEVSTLTKTINTLSEQLTEAEATIKKMVPPIGAVLIQINDPVLEYPGTQWEPQDYGNHPLWITYDKKLHGNYLCELFDEDGNKIKFTMKKDDGSASENGTPLPYLAWQRVR